MKLGLIARADQTGLGVQSWEAFNNLRPAKTLVVDICHLSPKNLSLHLDRFPGAKVVSGFPTDEDYRQFLTDLDVVLTFETAYNNNLYFLAQEAGTASVNMVNYEFLDHLQNPELTRPTLFLAPSTWHYDTLPFANKELLPFPVATEHYPPRHHPQMARHFRHVIGWPAIHDRAGTPEVISALALVRNPVTVSIACQDAQYAAALIKRRFPPHVQVRVEACETEHYWDVLDDADVLLAPRRFGGLYLTVNEALAAEMPVIMTDMAPNNDWLPADWLVPTTHVTDMIVRGLVEVRAAQPPALAELIDKFASNAAFYAEAHEQAKALGESISWKTLRPKFLSVLNQAIKIAAKPDPLVRQ